MATTESPQYCQENQVLLAKPAEMAAQVLTVYPDLPAKTAETERMVFPGVADPLATLVPRELPVKTARTASAGRWALQVRAVSTARTAKTAVMVQTVIPVCPDVTAATAATVMTAKMELLVPREIRATLVPRVPPVLSALAVPKETRATLVPKALAALRGRRVLEAKQAPTARTDCRVRGALKVFPARMVRAALPVPLETPAETDSWVPRVTMVALANKA